MPEVEMGKEYLAVNCRGCGRALAFREATEPPDVPVDLPPEIRMTCHVCGRADVWDADEVQHSVPRYKQ